MDSCQHLKEQGRLDSLEGANFRSVEPIAWNYGICFDTKGKDLSVESELFDMNVKQLTINILPCLLSSGCKSAAEVNNLRAYFVRQKVTTNLSNVDTPFSYSPFEDDVV